MQETIITILKEFWANFVHLGSYLLIGILIGGWINTFISVQKMIAYVNNNRKITSIAVATAIGAFTPFCSCNTIAILIPLINAGISWGPIFAFLVSSPIMDPYGFVLIAGGAGTNMALIVTLSSVFIGFLGGGIGVYLEKKNFLAGQLRIGPHSKPACCGSAVSASSEVNPPTGSCCGPVETVKVKACCDPGLSTTQSCCDSDETADSCCDPGLTATQSCCDANETTKVKGNSCCNPEPVAAQPCCGGDAGKKNSFFNELLSLAKWKEVIVSGFNALKGLLPYFAAFVLLAALIKVLLPNQFIVALFGQKKVTSVLFATLLGIPLWMGPHESVPLVKSFIAMGMNKGAVFSFLFAGQATSIPAMGALLMLVKWRIFLIYLGIITVTSLVIGYLIYFFG